MKNLSCLITCAIFLVFYCHAQQFVSTEKKEGSFPVFNTAAASSIYTDTSDDWLVQKTASFLQGDIEKVGGKQPEIIHTINQPSPKNIIIIGTLHGSPLVQQLAAAGKLIIDSIKGKWEAFSIQTISKPFNGVDNALVITGSDKRGAAYGVFELSKQMGVSPWYWWADVPVKKKTAVYVNSGKYVFGPPSVQYRGIFINDEAPAFSGWTREKFGGVNHLVYEKMFELLLRLKANYLWPAMWGNAFNDDDTLNPVMADKYGIVMGTSHHEPMLRAQQEWKRYGKGAWNYQTNDSVLRAFWTKGMQHMGAHESIVTIGMRGDGDMPMTEGSNIALLEKIVADQRKIIGDVTGRDVTTVPQSWALYKEVQDYYDKGMRVPDDVTLLLCDDNWGDIRKLPKPTDKPRKGGYGIYYHFDYVGDPRNYKWLNTNNIARVWEQMHLAKEYGADKIWIVNVGDLKLLEYPISFFLDYAWDTRAWTADNISQYAAHWAAEQFGEEHAAEIGDILTKYSDYNSRRKPELLSPATYSLNNYNEADKVVDEYNALAKKAEKIYGGLAAEYKDAYYQLVLFPVQACANLNALHVTTAKNWLYAKQGRALTNMFADSVKVLFDKDAAISAYYNKTLAGGKWDHMADQTHISYTYWQQPDKDVLPAVKRIELPAEAEPAMELENSDIVWPGNGPGEAILPEFNQYVKALHFIDIFNKGQKPFTYSITAAKPWLKISQAKGMITTQQRIWFDVDWKNAPVAIPGPGDSTFLCVPITVKAGDVTITVYAMANMDLIPRHPVKNFMKYDGCVSVGAADYTKAVNAPSIHWQTIPQIGKAGNGITAFPVTAQSIKPSGSSPHLEYNVYLTDTGFTEVQAYFSPTIDFNGTGLHYAISLDGETPRVASVASDTSKTGWLQSVANNIRIDTTYHNIAKPGWHVLKYWYVDPAVVLQKIVVNPGGVKQSYLGPPETLAR